MISKFAIVSAVVIALFVGHLCAESCLSCDSRKDPNCAQNPSILLSKDCATHGETVECYTRIIDGYTIRGCTDEMDQGVLENCAKDSFNCNTCRNFNGQTGCNNNIFPLNRLTCHICSGDLNSNCSKSMDANPVACKLNQVDDQCYIRKTSKSVERGCLSDSETKCNNRSHCLICSGNGCNNEISNSTNIPVAPSSATMWKYSSIFVTALVAYSLKSVL